MFVLDVHDEWMFQVVGCGCWAGGAPHGTRSDCWHMHTGLDQITDLGLTAFSVALGSSTTITTVTLSSKYEWFVCWYDWARVLVCMRVCSVGVVCVFVLDVHDKWMFQVYRVCMLGGWRSLWHSY